MAQRVAVQTLQRRLYASAAPKPAASPAAASAVQTGQAANGMKLVAQQSESPLVRVVCAVKAGSRYEEAHQRGVSHCLRITSDLTQKQSRAFTIARDLQQMGGTVSCIGSREHLLYTLEVNKNLLPDALPHLAGMMSQQSFRPWEISDSMPKMDYELLGLTEQPQQRLVEKMHEVAYREAGLGRSLYAPAFMMSEFSPDLLKEYVNRNFAPDRVCLSAIGVDLEELKGVAADFTIEEPAKNEGDAPARYYGGELRENTEDLLAYTLLVGEGVSRKSSDLWAYAILEQLIGAGSSIRWASNKTSNMLNSAISKYTEDPYQVQAFNANYSDSGLFGISAVTVPDNSDAVLRVTMEQLRAVASSLPSKEALQGAKNRVKSTLAFQQECAEDLVQGRAIDQLTSDACADATSQMAAVDSVQASAVQSAAKRLVEGKMTMVSTGELYNVPYLDQL